MTKVRDRTEDFKEAVRQSARLLGYDEAKLASITLESTGELEQLLLKHRKAYRDLHRTTEQEIDSIEHEVLILSERLHSVTAQFDQLRAVRFQDAINRAIPRRMVNPGTRKDSTETSELSNMELREPDELHNEPVRGQQQLFDDETCALQGELTSLLGAVQETETKMVETSALNHLISTRFAISSAVLHSFLFFLSFNNFLVVYLFTCLSRNSWTT